MSLSRKAIAAYAWVLRLPHRAGLGRIKSVPGLRVFYPPLKWLRREVLGRVAPRVTEVRGHIMWADPQDSLGLLAAGTYEAFEVELFESLIRPGDVVVDLGANIGQHTLCFARAVGPEGQVFAFEPDPENHVLLRRNVAANGYSNIVAEQKAVSDSTGTLRLFQSKTNRGDHRIYDSDDGRPSVEVPVIRLDDYFSSHDRPISFVKMDIQGAEYAALQGMRDVLQRNPDMRLFIEYWPWGLKRAGVEAQDLLALLLDHGFRLQEVDGRKGTIRAVSPSELLEAYSPDNPLYTNLLCVRQH